MSEDSPRISRRSRFLDLFVVLTTLIIMISVRTLYYIAATNQIKKQMDAASSSRIHGVVDANTMHRGGRKNLRKRHHKHLKHQGDNAITRHDIHTDQSLKGTPSNLLPKLVNPFHNGFLSPRSMNELFTVDVVKRVSFDGSKDRDFIRHRETESDVSDGIEI